MCRRRRSRDSKAMPKNIVERIATFNGLFNLSRGLVVAFLVAAVLCLVAGSTFWSAAALVAALLSLYRMRKFNGLYCKNVLQTFIALKDSARE